MTLLDTLNWIGHEHWSEAEEDVREMGGWKFGVLGRR